MQIIRQISAMRGWSEAARGGGERIALVPTMGFLHQGHLSLVREAKRRAGRVVVSIFVNPKQFGPSEDFAGYPRDFERDCALLEKEEIDVLFHPAVEDMYPPQFQTRVEVDKLSLPLCGAVRPGHFRGVTTVVAKLLNIVHPHAAIFGEKDYQQLQVVRRMVQDLNIDTEIIGHPIVREPDGLAMSSRNVYLTPAERQAAVCLSRSLRKAEGLFKRGERAAGAIVHVARAELEREPLARVEYVKLCDAETLDELERIEDRAVLALAVRIGRARLIDNRVLGR
ncbi:MAG TPA: pantoate--beta-alanine ligase [Methylomirabilota bacterium]|nr:pantoate--beta-alanine ligase [Methylomirabilota bacterium]